MADKDKPIRLYGILSGLLRKGNAEVYITGSNSKFLSSDIRTEFRDRGDDIYIALYLFPSIIMLPLLINMMLGENIYFSVDFLMYWKRRAISIR